MNGLLGIWFLIIALYAAFMISATIAKVNSVADAILLAIIVIIQLVGFAVLSIPLTIELTQIVFRLLGLKYYFGFEVNGKVHKEE